MFKQFVTIIENCGQIKNIFGFNHWWNYKQKEYKSDNLESNKRQFGTYISKIQISKCSTTR